VRFDSDIFISYAHIDNQPLTPGDEGWITNLHRALEIRLAQLLGEEPKIWRDPKIQGNDYFDTAIVSQLPKTALLISIITPRYLKSEWCRKELDEFSQYGPIEVERKSRIFKVVKTPVPIDRTPEQLQRMLGYEFFQLDPETGRPIEFRPEPGTGEARKYWAKMDDLAYDLFQLLESLKTPAAATPAPAAAADGPVVFLAETTFDLAAERDALRRELLERGYRVLPERPLPLAAEELEKSLQQDLPQCALSVHLVGERYGVIPDGAELSMVDLQNRQAIRQSRERGLRRIVWVSRENQPRDARQAAFLDTLRQDPAALEGAEFLQTTLEDLKSLIEARLRVPPPEEEKEEDAAGAEGEISRIYLICDRDDQEDARSLDDYLFSQGYEVISPLFEGDEATVRQDHQENLCLCDAAIIYYGKATEVWLRAKLRDFLKVAGFGRKKPLAARAVYIGPPARPDKDRFRTHEAMVIRGSATVSGDDLQPFFAELQQNKKGGK
jgi:hypothetical protein